MEKDSIEHLKTDLDRKGMIVPKQLLELSSVVGQGIIALLFIHHTSEFLCIYRRVRSGVSWLY